MADDLKELKDDCLNAKCASQKVLATAEKVKRKGSLSNDPEAAGQLNNLTKNLQEVLPLLDFQESQQLLRPRRPSHRDADSGIGNSANSGLFGCKVDVTRKSQDITVGVTVRTGGEAATMRHTSASAQDSQLSTPVQPSQSQLSRPARPTPLFIQETQPHEYERDQQTLVKCADSDSEADC